MKMSKDLKPTSFSVWSLFVKLLLEHIQTCPVYPCQLSLSVLQPLCVRVCVNLLLLNQPVSCVDHISCPTKDEHVQT